jgi:hypothetical protein
MRATVLAGITLVLAACSILPIPPVPPVLVEPPDVVCDRVASVEAGRDDLCGEVFDVVQARFPAEIAAASLVVISDDCPPEVSCDRAFVYSAMVVVVPEDGDLDASLKLHVFGHWGEALRVEPWVWEMPEHVAELLNQG